jgi:hypothetical protein
MVIDTATDPVRARVAANLRAFRQARSLGTEELAERCASASGRPFAAADLQAAEDGERGVEAGELVTLAIALGVAVPDLLSPTADEGPDTAVPVGPGIAVERADYVDAIGVRRPAGADAAPASVKARLREAGWTTEQLRDRFGPPAQG